jgi:hypothetical protein
MTACRDLVMESRHIGCDPESEANCQRIAVAMGASRYLSSKTSHNRTSRVKLARYNGYCSFAYSSLACW